MKTILITGASSGIGKHTAIELGKQGYRLIIHGIDFEGTKAVYDEIVANGNSNVFMHVADFSNMSGVKKFADEVKSEVDVIDALYNNAGAQFGDVRQVSDEGHEKTLAINVLAPFLLTHLLLPLLKKSESARIVTQSSEGYHLGGEPCLEDIELEQEGHYQFGYAYNSSKRFVWWIMNEYADRLKAEGVKNVTVNCCEPGVSMETGLDKISKQNPEYAKIMENYKQFSRPVSVAAECGIYLLTSPEVEGMTGGFYGDCQPKEIDPVAVSEEGQKFVWNFCEKVCAAYME